MPARPDAVIFDVNETLFSLDGLRARLDRVAAPDGTLERWFAQVLSAGFAVTAAGGFVAFRDVAADTLARMLDDRERALEVLGGFGSLDPHPDVEPALRVLDAAGVPAVTLTNGHAETTEALLERCGLRHLVARCTDVGPSGAWKPAPAPYLWCVDALGLAPHRVAMVAVHSWDVHGARAAGLITGYAARHEGGRLPPYASADVEADDLVGVIDELLSQ